MNQFFCLIILSFFSLLVSACSVTKPGGEPTITPFIQISSTDTPDHTATFTLEPVNVELATRFAGFDATSTVKAKTPSPTVTNTSLPTDTSLPTETRTPKPTLTPWPTAGPLSNQGPWLILEQTVRDPVGFQEYYFVADVNGANLQPIVLPDKDEVFGFKISPSERGHFLAFIETMSDWSLLDTEAFRYYPSIWIVELPGNRIVRKIPLLGEEGWQQVVRERERGIQGIDVSLTLGLVANIKSFVWSPDGHYLAFSSAMAGTGANLYLYNAERDEIQQITALKEEGVQPWFWSTDSQWLIYRTGKNYAVDAAPALAGFTGVWALSMERGSRPHKLYEPSQFEEIERITANRFYVYDWIFEGDPRNLRRVNIETGWLDVLYTERFSNVAIDDKENILLRFSKEVSWSYSYKDIQDGIYRLLPEKHLLENVISGTFGCLYWDSMNNVFKICQVPKNYYYRFNSQGVFSQISVETAGLPSPDGRFRVVRLLPDEWESENDIVKVIRSSGQEAADLMAGWRMKFRWTPDSQSFFYLACEDGCYLYRHQRENAWGFEKLANQLYSTDGSKELEDYWLLVP